MPKKTAVAPIELSRKWERLAESAQLKRLQRGGFLRRESHFCDIQLCDDESESSLNFPEELRESCW